MKKICRHGICKTFEPGPDDICVLIRNETETDELVRKCDKEKTCNATSWLTTESAFYNATCVNASYPVVNQTLPGDICTESSECFSGMFSNATCAGGVCTTTSKIGSECTVGPDEPADYDTRSCPVGAYCDSTTKKCTKQLGKGRGCNGFEQCTTGNTCVNVTEPSIFRQDAYYCRNYWSMYEGFVFDATYATRTGFLLTLNDK